MHKLYKNKFRFPHAIIEKGGDLRRWAAKDLFFNNKKHDVSSNDLLRAFFNLWGIAHLMGRG